MLIPHTLGDNDMGVLRHRGLALDQGLPDLRLPLRFSLVYISVPVMFPGEERYRCPNVRTSS